jgi:hypothetical protein
VDVNGIDVVQSIPFQLFDNGVANFDALHGLGLLKKQEGEILSC